MENTSDIKAIMARLQASGLNPNEGSSAPPARTDPPARLKQPLQASLSTGAKKPVSESFPGNLPPKPSFLKNISSTNTHTSGNETSNRPVMPQKVLIPAKPNSEIRDVAIKSTFCKPPLTSDLKPAFPKPQPVFNAKPSWVMNRNGNGPSSVSPPPKIPVANHISSNRLWQQSEEKPDDDAPKKFPPPSNTPFKLPSTLRSLQSNYTKETETTAEGMNTEGGNKTCFPALASVAPPIPAPSKKPSVKINSPYLHAGPKQKSLPHPATLGPAPIKPQRPPNVNLDIFREAETTNGSQILKKGPTPTQSCQATVPTVPQRHPGPMIHSEEIYDDVDELNDSNAPPPLPPMTSHPSQGAKICQESDDDEEMYEDLEDRWDEQEVKNKNEKDREAGKKEQKERGKKEQEARKKFKLVGPLSVIQQGKALLDCKSSKTDLALKQGDSLDIISIQGTPEGKWLARNLEGSIGYVKITSVDIDFNSLKTFQAQQAYDPEVYDDIELASSDNSGVKGSTGTLPPPPAEDGEIYDDVVDPKLHDQAPPPPPCLDRSSDQRGAAVDEEIYDDVDSHSPPLLPPISSIPTLKNKNKGEEIDLKKQKKMEKEEKEFKKKFKYEGDIQVLGQVTILPTMSNKKWSGKDLSIKAGEKLDVIVKPVDNKMICRNAEGKFGYVSTVNIVTDDGDIYDDVGEDCIYDND